MKVTKNNLWSVVISLLLLILFNVTTFALPAEHSVIFWLGYSFGMFANLFLLNVSVFILNSKNTDETFHRLSIFSVSLIYFIIQTAFSIWQITDVYFPYTTALIIDVLLAVISSVLLITALSAGKEIEAVEAKITTKVYYVKNLKTDLELLESNNDELTDKIKELTEAVRFSDPMSHSQLMPIEGKIQGKLEIIKDNLDNSSIALAACQDMQKLLNERNKKCKLLKNIPEEKFCKEQKGVNILPVTFGVIAFFVIVILFIVFIITPNSKYNNANELYNMQYYKEAVVEFEKLGDYKDSKDKLEQIYNKLPSDNEIYFGEYKGNPIPWEILETKNDCMLLITKEPVEKISFNNELENITYKDSSIRRWLNNEFIAEFSDEQKDRILSSNSSLNDKIFLLDKELYEKYSDTIDFKTASDWWLSTKTDAGMMYVEGDTCKINTYGEGVVRALGARPCVWVKLVK